MSEVYPKDWNEVAKIVKFSQRIKDRHVEAMCIENSGRSERSKSKRRFDLVVRYRILDT